MSAIIEPRTGLEVLDDLTLEMSQISDAIACVCVVLPDRYINVVPTLRLLQHSLEDAKSIAEELYERVPS